MAAPTKKSALSKSKLSHAEAMKGNKFAVGNNGGRPLKYTDEWLKEEAKALIEFIAKDGGNYIGSFARQRGYHRRRIPEFVKSSEEFALAYEEAQQWQEEKFLTNALTRFWDPGFAAKAMARVCGDEWKNSWDKEEEKSDTPTNIIINKIEK